MDLFSGNLDAISLADVESFLSITLPENDRMPEGTRVDYKEHLPSDIADDAAAMANSQGGLIFIGVKAKVNAIFKQNIPDAIPGTSSLGNDAKARITNKIVTSINPIPNFDIGVCGTGVPNQMIAVIRVEQGTEPPYESTIGGKYRISIRTQDSKRQASLIEIQRFLDIRESGKKTTNEILAQWQNQQQGQDYQRALFIPATPLKLRADLRFENEFRGLLDPKQENIKRQERGGEEYTVISNDEKTFMVDDKGNLGFAANLSRRGSPGEWVGDPIDDLAFFCTFAYRFFDQHRYHGNLTVAHAMSCYSVTFLPQFAVVNATYKSKAISFPPVKFTQFGQKPEAAFRQIDVAWSSLKDPSETVAEIMLYQLRQLRQANIDYTKFVEEIRARWGNRIS